MKNKTTESELRAQLEIAENRIEEMHAIIERKNVIIRLMAMGDLSLEEIGLSD